MTDLADWTFLEPLRGAEARLLAEGSPFEVIEQDVRGERMTVFKQRALNLGDLLDMSAGHGDKEFLVFDGGPRITFAEHHRLVCATAVALRDDYGIGKGDRVALCAANSPGWILTAHACFMLGAVVVAMNSWWSADELAAAVDATSPRLIVADEKRRERLAGRTGECTMLADEEVLGEAAGRGDDTFARPDVHEDDPAVLLFTSGTSGKPKAAILSHRCLVGFVQFTAFIGARGALLAGITTPPATPMVRLAVFPLFHVSGLGTLEASVAFGHTTVWPSGRFDAPRVIELTRTEHISLWGGASTHLIRLLDHPDLDTFERTQLLQVGIGGSASTPSLIARTETQFPHLKDTFSSGYGMTECGGLATYATNAMLSAAPDCVGEPLPTVEIRVIDDVGNTVRDGEVGTVCVRSPIVMHGYWDNPDANAAALLPRGWLRTEDFGRLVDGILFLNSRRRDLIIRGGENVYPTEIEDCLDQHSDVIESAVIGRAHDELGQEVCAVVVVRAGATTTADSLRQHCAERIAYFKVPTGIDVRIDPLPRNAAGKVLKHLLEQGGTSTDIED